MAKLIMAGEIHNSRNLCKIGEILVPPFVRGGSKSPLLVEACFLTKRELALIDGGPILKPSDHILTEKWSSNASNWIRNSNSNLTMFMAERKLYPFNSVIEPIEPSSLMMMTIPIYDFSAINPNAVTLREMIWGDSFQEKKEELYQHANAIVPLMDKIIGKFAGKNTAANELHRLEIRIMTIIRRFYSNFTQGIDSFSFKSVPGLAIKHIDKITLLRSAIQTLGILDKIGDLQARADDSIHTITGRTHILQILEALTKRRGADSKNLSVEIFFTDLPIKIEGDIHHAIQRLRDIKE